MNELFTGFASFSMQKLLTNYIIALLRIGLLDFSGFESALNINVYISAIDNRFAVVLFIFTIYSFFYK